MTRIPVFTSLADYQRSRLSRDLVAGSPLPPPFGQEVDLVDVIIINEAVAFFG